MKIELLLKRLISMTVVLISAIAVISACQSSATTRAPTIITPSISPTEQAVKPDYLSDFALAQKVAEAINHEDQTTILYQSIPDQQRPEIMLDEFVQYISLIRRGINGTVTALTRVSEPEMKVLYNDLRYGSEMKHIGFFLHFTPPGKLEETIAFFMQQTAEGMPYLDKGPLTKALAIQNFAALYFDAIDRYDRDALSVLVRSDSGSRDHQILKADRILSFYRNEIVTDSPSFQVDSLMPDRIVFSQQIFIDQEKTQIGTRIMTVYADGTTGFMVDDPMLDELAIEDLVVMYEDNVLFDMSKLVRNALPLVTSSHVTPLLDQPILHDDTTCKVLDDKSQAMTAYYSGMTIEGIGRCDQHKYWRVNLKKATMTDPLLSLGSGLSVGDSLDDLLMKYPFLDETGYQIERSVGVYRMMLIFSINEMKISEMTLSISGN